jgi:thymidylate synthase (FAD)
MEFIEPIELMDRPHLVDIWYNGCINSEKGYRDMMALGATAQEARALLNNSLKTEIRVSMNLRSLRNFLELRCAKNAHTHIKELTIPLLFMLKEKIPGIFDDIPWDKTFENKYLSEDRWREYFPDEMNK